jgi:hypothetical protein
MKKVVLTYGLIAGAIFMAFMFGAYPFWKNGTITFENGEIVGYTSMVIALSMIFFGVKSYRDNYLQGSITFGKALKVGGLIALVAALGYAISWEFYFNLIAPDFMDEYASFSIEKARAGNMTEAKVQELITSMSQMKEWYKNPILRFGMTLTEVLPVGILIALLSAGILRKKGVLPAEEMV